jgi:HAD superfamily hydrolase (TIGR01509 family)
MQSIRAAAAKRMTADAVDAFMHAWQNAERLLNEDMLALVGRLRANGYQTGVISNTIPGLEERLRAEVPHLIPLFDIRIGSGDVKMAKPDPAIFHHALELAGAEPRQAVFADDVSAYAAAARDIGMHGFHFTGYERFAEDLRSIGVRH